MLSRKLTGTKIRPLPLTPQNEVSKRPALCETMATRPPIGTPRASRPAPVASANFPRRENVTSPIDGAGWSASSTKATRSGYTAKARSR